MTRVEELKSDDVASLADQDSAYRLQAGIGYDRSMSEVSPQRQRRKWIFRGLYLLYSLLVIGGGLWLYGWMMIPAAPDSLGEEAVVWNYFYPELKDSGAADVKTAPESDLKVLLLGASVMEQIVPALESRLHEEFGDRMRVYNLAKSAHTTRDSVLKYRLLDPQEFDLVIVYHGINDVRMNYCPREYFREDYTHIAWYRGIQRHVKAGTLIVKDVVREQFERVWALGKPDPEEWHYGAEIKTRQPFHNNLEEIISRSNAAQTPILLMSFAWWLPEQDPGGTTQPPAAYGEGQYKLSADLWGNPQYLPLILNAHNEVIRNLSESPQVLFVDQESLMPKDGETFSDPCHLTEAGELRFVENLWPTVKQTLESAR